MNVFCMPILFTIQYKRTTFVPSISMDADWYNHPTIMYLSKEVSLIRTPLRNMTVEDRPFVYWYQSGHRFQLNLSPAHDKNCKVSIIFTAIPPAELLHSEWNVYEVTAQLDDVSVTFSLAKPQGVATIIHHLLKTESVSWFLHTPQVIENGWALLAEMGYKHAQPLWIKQY